MGELGAHSELEGCSEAAERFLGFGNVQESSSPQFFKKQTIINNLNEINNLKSKLLNQNEVSFYVKKIIKIFTLYICHLIEIIYL